MAGRGSPPIAPSTIPPRPRVPRPGKASRFAPSPSSPTDARRPAKCPHPSGTAALGPSSAASGTEGPVPDRSDPPPPKAREGIRSRMTPSPSLLREGWDGGLSRARVGFDGLVKSSPGARRRPLDRAVLADVDRPGVVAGGAEHDRTGERVALGHAFEAVGGSGSLIGMPALELDPVAGGQA